MALIQVTSRPGLPKTSNSSGTAASGGAPDLGMSEPFHPRQEFACDVPGGYVFRTSQGSSTMSVPSSAICENIKRTCRTVRMPAFANDTHSCVASASSQENDLVMCTSASVCASDAPGTVDAAYHDVPST